ncbi:MAG TPA: alpha/beta hydrolase [Mucilaginibacter sp.]|jgi:acetyl esterase/lipase|nr:alpha/beta hydrolase [Mucilaginibacter sp.]
MKKLAFITLLFFSMVSLINAQDIKTILLYPKDIPNSKPTPANYVETNDKGWVTKVSIPVLVPYFAAKPTGTAVIIIPGGSYAGVSMENEGANIAQAFNKIGVTAFVLKFRLTSDKIMLDKTIAPLQDAQTAILIVRNRAAEWGINPAKIGLVGFSGGGHLAATAGTHFDKAVIANKDNISLRPDFMILAYPVISFEDGITHVGTREGLLGKNPTSQQVELYSNEKQVTANTPPTFLVHAQDDNAVPVQNSLVFYDALSKAKVKAEMHIYQSGGHGFGLNNKKSNEHWFDWCASWLQANGF